MTFHADNLIPVSARTVRSAEAELDRMEDRGELRPDVLRAMRAEVKGAAAVSTQMVDELAASHHDEVQGARAGWLSDLCGIRDDFATLEADIRAGRVTAADARKRWNDLHKEHGSYRTRVIAEAERRAALVAEMEEDPTPTPTASTSACRTSCPASRSRRVDDLHTPRGLMYCDPPDSTVYIKADADMVALRAWAWFQHLRRMANERAGVLHPGQIHGPSQASRHVRRDRHVGTARWALTGAAEPMRHRQL